MQQTVKVEMQERLEGLRSQLSEVNAELDELGRDYDVEGQVTYLELLNKREQIERRIMKLESQLSMLKSKTKTRKSNGKISTGHKVTIKDGPKKIVAQIVDGIHMLAAEKVISTSSPLGQALLGKSSGEDVVVATPAGPKSYKILAIG